MTPTPAEKLRNLRENRFSYSIAKAKLAKHLELSHRQSYEKYEDGLVKISASLIAKVSEFFKITPDYFLDTCYGKTIFLAPYFKGYDDIKGRHLYEDLNKMSSDVYINKDYFAADFFLLNVPEEASQSDDYIDYMFSPTPFRKETLNIHKINNNNIPFEDIIRKVEHNEKDRDATIIMKKCLTSDIIFETNYNLYLIMEKNNKKLYLAFIKKQDRHFTIIPYYDLMTMQIINHYSYFDELGFQQTVGNKAIEQCLEPLTIKDIHILAKTINIWDPMRCLG